jgi:hypothetical protein
MYNPAHQLMYINIPKNISTWTVLNFKSLGWSVYNYYDDRLYTTPALVVLRDPVSRWISGISEYFAINFPSTEIKDFSPLLIDTIFNVVCFDDHTEKQIYFIEGLKLNNCDFLKVDTNYSNNFIQWCKDKNLNTDVLDMEPKHVSSIDPIRKKFTTFFSELINREPTRLQQIKDYYKLDYELCNSTTYYDAR